MINLFLVLIALFSTPAPLATGHIGSTDKVLTDAPLVVAPQPIESDAGAVYAPAPEPDWLVSCVQDAPVYSYPGTQWPADQHLAYGTRVRVREKEYGEGAAWGYIGDVMWVNLVDFCQGE